MGKRVGRIILSYFLIFVILISSYCVLLALSSMIPSSWMEENVRVSSEILVEKGEIENIPVGYKDEQLFLFSDALMINTAYSIDSKTPLTSALLARRDYIPGKTKVEHEDLTGDLGVNEKFKNPDSTDVYMTKALYGLMHGDEITESYEYARYWHGYLVFLRPLLTLFNINGIRVLFLSLTVFLVGFLVYLMYKKINLISAIIMLVSLLSINIFVVSFSINEMPIMFISIISTIFILLRKDKIKDIGKVFFIIGSITSFIDLLTTPLITFAIPLTIYFLLELKEKDLTIKETICMYIKLGITWCLGYGLTWLTKWVISDLFLGRHVFSNALTQANVRTAIPSEAKITLFTIIKRNLDRFTLLMLMIVSIICAVYAIIAACLKNDMEKNVVKVLPFLVTIILPFVWYGVLRNHSFIHIFFTNRLFVICVLNMQILTAMLFGFYNNRLQENRTK